ncbi:DUF4397 domain-containing protein [Pedobacter sp. Du54]|uniref:DUF4397 domain-containing protein n=1 Tax=Pedobacter anseongensis TaxID=3133439 RepID=UPI0030A96EA2
MHYSRKTILLLATVVVMAFASCKKDTIETPLISALSFVNASPGSPALDAFIGENKINDDLFTFGKNMGYLNAYSGEREISFYQGSNKKISAKFNLKDGKFYSVFLTGKWPETELVLLKDSLTKTAAGKAHIRFVNMGINSGVLNLGLTNGSTLITQKAYKTASDFVAVNGDTGYTFVIRNNAALTDTVSIPQVTLESGHSYTIWAKGAKGETGNDALGVSVIKNY